MLAKAANLIQFLRVEDGGDERASPSAISSPRLDQARGREAVDLRPAQGRLFRGGQAADGLLAEEMRRERRPRACRHRPSRRVWFVLDRAGRPASASRTSRGSCPKGRKFGAAIVLTFQALGQMRHRYGANIAEAMLACCNAKLFLQNGRPVRPANGRARPSVDCEIEMRVATDTLSIGGRARRARPSRRSGASALPCWKASCGSRRIRAICCFPTACPWHTDWADSRPHRGARRAQSPCLRCGRSEGHAVEPRESNCPERRARRQT